LSFSLDGGDIDVELLEFVSQNGTLSGLEALAKL
jgi:hypothetical protein